MKAILFNRNPVIAGKVIEQPAQDFVKNTLSLWNLYSAIKAIKHEWRFLR
jgi:hypothetical protein